MQFGVARVQGQCLFEFARRFVRQALPEPAHAEGLPEAVEIGTQRDGLCEGDHRFGEVAARHQRRAKVGVGFREAGVEHQCTPVKRNRLVEPRS